tara:strand:+ start:430 stop:687 length:258 start_codon:yes stop_codon:yes gene_type:complete
MRVAKRYIAKVERTLWTCDTVHIVAESEEDAMNMLRAGQGNVVRTEIQEEKANNRWIDSSVPLTTEEFFDVTDSGGPTGESTGGF